jgi:hypothetical protein
MICWTKLSVAPGLCYQSDKHAVKAVMESNRAERWLEFAFTAVRKREYITLCLAQIASIQHKLYH